MAYHDNSRQSGGPSTSPLSHFSHALPPVASPSRHHVRRRSSSASSISPPPVIIRQSSPLKRPIANGTPPAVRYRSHWGFKRIFVVFVISTTLVIAVVIHAGGGHPRAIAFEDTSTWDMESSGSSSSPSGSSAIGGVTIYSKEYLSRAFRSISRRLRSTGVTNLYKDIKSLPKSWQTGRDWYRPLNLDGIRLDRDRDRAGISDARRADSGRSTSSFWSSMRNIFRNPAPYIFSADSRPYSEVSWDTLDPAIRDFREWEYSRSLLYSGTGDRILRFLEKARSGRGFTVSVVGGSVSKGRGLPPIADIDFAEADELFDYDEDDEEIGSATQLRTHTHIHSHNHPHRRSLDSKGSALSAASEVTRRKKRHTTKEFVIDPSPQVSRNLYHPLNIHQQIFQFLNATFPANRPGSAPNVFVNGAQGGVGSDYFAGCWKEHIPEDSDLVIIELGINDERNLEAMVDFELLSRSLLEMKSQPAILVIQTLTLLFPTLSQASSLHLDVAAYYDIPVLSLRDVLMPRILNDPTIGENGSLGEEIKKWFRNVDPALTKPGDAKVVDGVDLMHISHHGHTLLADLAIHHLELQMQRLQPWNAFYAETDGTQPDDIGTDIPGMLLASSYHSGQALFKDDPFCSSTNSAFEHRRLTIPSYASGSWHEWAWGEKRYLVTQEPGSTISFDIDVLATSLSRGRHAARTDGYVRVAYQRSMTLGLGSLECWTTTGHRRSVDDQEERSVDDDPQSMMQLRRDALGRPGDRKVRLDGYWNQRERNKVIVSTVRDDLSPGRHTLHCRLMDETADPQGGHEFRLVAVVHN